MLQLIYANKLKKKLYISNQNTIGQVCQIFGINFKNFNQQHRTSI